VERPEWERGTKGERGGAAQTDTQPTGAKSETVKALTMIRSNDTRRGCKSCKLGAVSSSLQISKDVGYLVVGGQQELAFLLSLLHRLLKHLLHNLNRTNTPQLHLGSIVCSLFCAAKMADGMEDDGPAYAQRPDGMRMLRACKTCKLIKTLDQVRSVCPRVVRRVCDVLGCYCLLCADCM
jgi:hypothetical protein